jgi:hypothetical protein
MGTDEDDFRAAVVSLQRQGWRVFKQNGEWFHKCAACAEGGVDNFEDDFEDVS